MKNTYEYRGFKIKQDGKDFDVKSSHGWSPAVRDAKSINHATKQLDDFLAGVKKIQYAGK